MRGGQKHTKNDDVHNSIGWSFSPLVVETYDGWGHEVITKFSHLSKVLVLHCRQLSATLIK